MRSHAPGLNDLPTELLLSVFGFLESNSDLLTLYRLTHRLHKLLLPLIFDKHLARVGDADGDHTLQHALVEIFCYAVAKNQLQLIQQLTTYPDLLDLKGRAFPSRWDLDKLADQSHRQMAQQPITYLQFALLMDAPYVSSHLIKHGASILHKYGLSPLHTALARRERWRGFDALHAFLYPRVPRDEHPRVWESMVTAVVAELLRYGANPSCRTSSSRAHKCGYRCWKSISCENRGQTPLHLAAGSGFWLAAHQMLCSGADAENRSRMLEGGDEEGSTPLYSALVQGQGEVIVYLLGSQGERNPIVNTTTRSTALHIACRFALSGVVGRLLRRGADVDVVDFYGQTPLHELLTQTLLGRQEAVLETMHNLADFGANPDINTGTGDLTPRQVGAKHPFVEVRTLLEATELRVCVNAKGELAIAGGKGIWDATRAASIREERERVRVARAEEQTDRMNERKSGSEGLESSIKQMSRGTKNRYSRKGEAEQEPKAAAKQESSMTDRKKVETADIVRAQTRQPRPRPALMPKPANTQPTQRFQGPKASQKPMAAPNAGLTALRAAVFTRHVFWDLEAQKRDIESRMPKM
ncbi:putative ankyrin 2,3/unc44 [Diplocarpon rosae]|nr:putative ankyrin 2,3/unc44 [Diplocarpon rosae]